MSSRWLPSNDRDVKSNARTAGARAGVVVERHNARDVMTSSQTKTRDGPHESRSLYNMTDAHEVLLLPISLPLQNIRKVHEIPYPLVLMSAVTARMYG